MKNIIIIILIFVLSTGCLFAAFRQSPQLYRGLRPLGMGNAFIGVSDDHNALFYNPAGLNDVEKLRIEIINPTVEISANVYNIIKTVLDVKDDVGNGASSSSDVFDTVVDRHLGEFTSIRAAMSPGVTMHNFAAKIVAEPSAYFSFRNRVFPNLEYEGKVDMGLAAGGAYGLWDKIIQFGAAVKPIYRMATDQKSLGIHNYDTFSDELSDFQRGIGVGLDVGFKSHLDTLANWLDIEHITPIANYLRPAVGLTIQEIPIKEFGGSVENYMSLSAGGAINFDFWKFKNVFALDVRDMNRAGHPLNKLAIGVESQWELHKKLLIPGGRIGLWQGRPTIGISCDFLRIWRGEIAMYYEEIGEQQRTKGDLRIALNLTLLQWY